MIDTVHFELEIKLDENELKSDWRRSETTYPDQSIYVSYQKGRSNKKQSPYLRYHYRDEDIPTPKLEVQIQSVPKLFANHNQLQLGNIDLIILTINDYLRTVAGLTKINVKDALINRVDFFNDYDVNGHVKDYLSAIATLEYPHRDRNIFKNRLRFGSDKNYVGNGVVFYSENEETVFYDKEQQSNRFIAEGLLRHEKRFTSRASFKKAINTHSLSSSPILCQLNWAFVKRELQKDLEILGLDKSIQNRYKAVSVIIKTGNIRECNLYKNYLLLSEHKELSSIELVQKLKCEPGLIRDWKKTLKEANICPGFAKNDKTNLPPLTLPDEPQPILTQIKKLNRKHTRIANSKSKTREQERKSKPSE